MTSLDSLPRKTFARKIVSMQGYTREQAITEIVSIDHCSQEEAERRYDLANVQKSRRSAAQFNRHALAKRSEALAQDLVLILARENGIFSCPSDLSKVSIKAGWGDFEGYETTGRVYREFIMPFQRDGLLAEKRDDEEHLIGYTITDAGMKYLKDI